MTVETRARLQLLSGQNQFLCKRKRSSCKICKKGYGGCKKGYGGDETCGLGREHVPVWNGWAVELVGCATGGLGWAGEQVVWAGVGEPRRREPGAEQTKEEAGGCGLLG
jgi:hypothetical protein